MRTKDDIGPRGEAIFRVRISEPCGPQGTALFRPQFLGDKFPTFDFLVELTGLQDRSAFFLAQVKTTTLGLTKKVPIRLRTNRVSQGDVDRMLHHPVPTYVFGIDEIEERAYIASVNGTTMGPIDRIPTTYPLDRTNLHLLWSEVSKFWGCRDMILTNSVYSI